jgi:hypothetical protein
MIIGSLLAAFILYRIWISITNDPVKGPLERARDRRVDARLGKEAGDKQDRQRKFVDSLIKYEGDYSRVDRSIFSYFSRSEKDTPFGKSAFKIWLTTEKSEKTPWHLIDRFWWSNQSSILGAITLADSPSARNRYKNSLATEMETKDAIEAEIELFKKLPYPKYVERDLEKAVEESRTEQEFLKSNVDLVTYFNGKYKINPLWEAGKKKLQRELDLIAKESRKEERLEKKRKAIIEKLKL